MRSLLHVIKGSSTAGQDLPEILPPLTIKGVRFRRGQLALLSSHPGRGKTLFALWYAVKIARQGEPVLYISADSDQGTLANRVGAILMNRTVNDVKDMRESEAVDDDANELAALTRRLRIDRDPNPTLDDVWEETQAFEELLGVPPSLIVVDVLLNVHTELDGWAGLLDAVKSFHTLARETEACVLVLHHTREEGNATRPGPMNATMGKVNQFPELILNIAMDGEQYWAAPVKNRDGVADPKAEQPIELFVDAESMSLFGTRQELETHRSRRQWV